MTSEHDIQTAILKGLGIEVMIGKAKVYATAESLFWRTNSGVHGSRHVRCNVPGCPDIVGVKRGRFVGIEVKKPGGKQSDVQAQFQHLAERAGGAYILTDNVAEALAEVRGIRGDESEAA